MKRDALILLLVSIVTFKVLMHIHATNIELITQAALGVVEGKPHWIAYQNRLLGPWLVYLVSSLSGISYQLALKACVFFLLALQNFLLFGLLSKMHIERVPALMLIVIYSLALLVLQDRWLYIWDYLDAVIFTAFAYGILQQRSSLYFVGLFFLALLNRESALFIALYIMIDAFHYDWANKRISLVSPKRLLSGVALMVAGMAYIKFIRDALFISRPDNSPDTAHELIGNHFHVFRNGANLFYYNFFSLEVINSLFVFGTLAWLFSRLRHYSEVEIKLVLIYLAMMANIMVFGLAHESRMYIILLPFLLLLAAQQKAWK